MTTPRPTPDAQPKEGEPRPTGLAGIIAGLKEAEEMDKPKEGELRKHVQHLAFAAHQRINSEACDNSPELFGKCESCNIIVETIEAALAAQPHQPQTVRQPHETTLEEAIKGHSHLSQQDYDSLVRDAMLWRQTVRQPRVDIEWVQKALAYASEARSTNTIKPDLLANAINKHFAPHSQPAEAQECGAVCLAWADCGNKEVTHGCILPAGHERGHKFPCVSLAEQAAYQRGAQAMAEKAVQAAVFTIWQELSDDLAAEVAPELDKAIRSLAGAVPNKIPGESPDVPKEAGAVRQAAPPLAVQPPQDDNDEGIIVNIPETTAISSGRIAEVLHSMDKEFGPVEPQASQPPQDQHPPVQALRELVARLRDSTEWASTPREFADELESLLHRESGGGK